MSSLLSSDAKTVVILCSETQIMLQWSCTEQYFSTVFLKSQYMWVFKTIWVLFTLLCVLATRIGSSWNQKEEESEGTSYQWEQTRDLKGRCSKAEANTRQSFLVPWYTHLTWDLWVTRIGSSWNWEEYWRIFVYSKSQYSTNWASFTLASSEAHHCWCTPRPRHLRRPLVRTLLLAPYLFEPRL